MSKKIRREASVYDAVAGRVGVNGFLPTTPYASKHRDTLSSSTVPVAPEEVLFRRRAAPVRHEGKDFYFAHENLPPNSPLPSSELLKAIHQYASDFYSRATEDHGQCDFRSLDETALIAVGVLLEEAMKEALGEDGDLVFTEPAYLDRGMRENKWTRVHVKGSVPKDPAASFEEGEERSSEGEDEEDSSSIEQEEHSDKRESDSDGTDVKRPQSNKRPRMD